MDGDEIYDSVRSLSQVLDDNDSLLNIRKAHAARQIQAARLEMQYDELDAEEDDDDGDDDGDGDDYEAV